MGWKRTGFVATVATLAACVAAVAAPSASSTPSTRVVAVNSLETSVLSGLNAIRAQHGLVPLKADPKLAAAADQHSREMAERGYFAHESADKSPFWKRVQRFYSSTNYRYWSVGENLLWASPDLDADAAVKMWMESPEHRANILTARWRQIGLSAVQVAAAPGTFNGLDVTIVTAEFGVRR